MTDPKREVILAAAARIEIQGKIMAFHAAALRGDKAEAVRLRREAHDVLDTALDLYVQIAASADVSGPL